MIKYDVRPILTFVVVRSEDGAEAEHGTFTDPNQALARAKALSDAEREAIGLKAKDQTTLPTPTLPAVTALPTS